MGLIIMPKGDKKMLNWYICNKLGRIGWKTCGWTVGNVSKKKIIM